MANRNLENYTNRKFLIREHEGWISHLQNSISIGFDTGHGSISNRKCQPGEINPSNRVNISTLKRSINETLRGKFFLCRSITPPYKTVSLETVVDDPEGENAVRLALYNYTKCGMGDLLMEVIPVGSQLLIKDPFFKTAAGDGGYILRVDNPSQVLFIEDPVFKIIFPGLVWKGNIPKQFQQFIPKMAASEVEVSNKSETPIVNSANKTKDDGYNPGDVIQDNCDPLVKIIFDQYKGKRCDCCFKTNGSQLRQLSRCGGCRLFFYCTKTCQNKDWKEGHKFECQSDSFKKPISNPFQPTDFKRQMFRLFAVLKMKPALRTKKYELYDGTSRSFDDLHSHQTKLKKDFRFTIFCEEMATDLEKEGKFVNNDEGMDYLLRLAGVWKTNAFPILNETENETIGSAIFIEPSVFDHSCKPNAFFNLIGCKMQIRAIASIPKGEKPFITYLVGNKTKAERASLLMERYNFVCKCERCIVEENKNLVDYGKLTNLIAVAQNQYTWKDYLETHESILTMLRKLYHEYDERITNRCFLGFQEAVGMGAPKKKVEKLAKSAKEHLLITFGAESPDFQKFLKFPLY